MNLLRKSIRFVNDYVRKNVLVPGIAVGVVFLVLAILSFFETRLLPDEILREIYATIQSVFAGANVLNSDGTLSFFGIFYHNLRAGVLITLSGFVPFLFLPVAGIVLNSVFLGSFLGIYSVFSNENMILMIAKYILPHGIFEIPALILQGAIGAKLCVVLCKKIFRKAKNESFVYHVKGCLGSFVLYVIPLLIVAAFIEAVILSALYL